MHRVSTARLGITTAQQNKSKGFKHLEVERSLYVTDMGKYKGQLKDHKKFMPLHIYEKTFRSMKIIENLKMAIDVSVNEVGPVISVNVIIATEAFTLLDDPRKFCCYARVAPSHIYLRWQSIHQK